MPGIAKPGQLCVRILRKGVKHTHRIWEAKHVISHELKHRVEISAVPSHIRGHSHRHVGPHALRGYGGLDGIGGDFLFGGTGRASAVRVAFVGGLLCIFSGFRSIRGNLHLLILRNVKDIFRDEE